MHHRLFVVVLCVLFPVVWGMLEEQAGQIDWSVENIGVPHFVFYPARKRPSMLVGTDEGVIASLSLKNGDLQWRQALPQSETLLTMQYNNEKSVFTLSTRDSASIVARMWSVDGALIWDSFISQPRVNDQQISDVQAFFLTSGDKSDVVVLVDDSISMRNGETGEAMWSWSYKLPRASVQIRFCFEKNDKLFFVSHHTDGSIATTILHARSGEVDSEHVIFDASFVASLGSRFETFLLSSSVANGNATLVNAMDGIVDSISLSSLFAEDSKRLDIVSQLSSATIRPLGRKGLALLQTSSFIHIISLPLRSVIRSVARIVGETHSFDFFEARSGSTFIAHAGAKGNVLSIDVINAEDAKFLHHIVTGVTFHSELSGIHLAVSSNEDKTVFGVTCTAMDGTVLFAQHGKVLWVREEALSDIRQTEFVGIPLSTSFAQSEFPSVALRFVPQVQKILAAVLSTLHETLSFGKSMLGIAAQQSSIPTVKADTFGLRNIIVVLTGRNKVLGIDSNTGTVVWSSLLPASNFTWCLHVLATDRVSVLGSDPKGIITYLHTINPLNGFVVSTEVFQFATLHAVAVPHLHGFARQLIIIDSQLAAHTYPAMELGHEWLVEHAAQLFFTIADSDVVKGYALSNAAAMVNAQNTWTLTFPSDVEKISAIASRSRESIQSTVRLVNGDSVMLNKYLNPNLIVIATVRAASSDRAIVKKSTDPSVTVYLVDSVTGTILDKIVHRYGSGPVHLTLSENSVVYHFWNTNTNQFEVSVIELYEDAEEAQKIDGAYSSFKSTPPQLRQQTFVLRSGVKALAVSSTLRGITSKCVLAGLQSDQILLIDRMLLDPRRPSEEITQAEKEEGVLPYAPDLPSDPLNVITYNKTVTRLRRIVTSYALLESTSLVFAYGLDLFFTRINPSQTFDLLNEDFNFLFLLATITGVLVLIVVTRRMAHAKIVSESFK